MAQATHAAKPSASDTALCGATDGAVVPWEAINNPTAAAVITCPACRQAMAGNR